MIGTLRAAECRFFIVEKSAVMVNNKLLNFSGVMGDFDGRDLTGEEGHIQKKYNLEILTVIFFGTITICASF